MKKVVLSILFCFFTFSISAQTADSLPLFKGEFSTALSGWKYQAGDDSTWKNPDFDDSQWYTIPNTNFSLDSFPPQWNGIGWFRLKFSVADSLKDQMHQLKVLHWGASEIYLDGKLIRKFGQVAANEKDTKVFRASLFFTPILLNNADNHVLAVRYSSFQKKQIGYADFNNLVGFRTHIIPNFQKILDERISDSYHILASLDDISKIGMGFCFTLAVVFLFSYFIAKQELPNLYLGLIMLCFFFMAFTRLLTNEEIITHNQELLHNIVFVVSIFELFYFMFLLFFLYSFFYNPFPYRAYYWLIFFIIIILVEFYEKKYVLTVGHHLLPVFLEIVRIISIAFIRKKKGVYTISIGFGVILFVFLFSYLVKLFEIEIFYFIVDSFILSAIFYSSIPLTTVALLAQRNAQNIKDLALQLVNIKQLSAEKQAILENQKEELEKQVTERTLELKETNEELHSTNDELHKKNEDITASITYAKRIQTAMLPRVENIQKALPESFILFKPRDIVSGDFYYFKEIANKIVIACADCTGHGVPGAFMSMIGNEILTNIVEIQGITSPDLILNELHKNIRSALKQGETENRDGMDISIVTIDKEKQILEYAGAMNPIYYVESDFPNRIVSSDSDLESRTPVLKEIKADKFPIGGSQKEQERTFTKHEIQLPITNEQLLIEQLQTSNHRNGEPFKPFQTILYLCSDGFQDQFGGAQGKKFMVKKFRELLFSIHHLPMNEQKQILDETIESWMAEGKEHQIDDILVMGIRI